MTASAATTRPPVVLIEAGPSAMRIRRMAHIVDLCLHEIPLCDPVVEAARLGGTIVTSTRPMHGDLLVRHGWRDARSKIRAENRLGSVAANFADGPHPCMTEALSLGVGSDALPRAVQTLEALALVLHAASDARTAMRPGTMATGRRRMRMEGRLRAVAHLLRTETGSDDQIVCAPTPWSPLTGRDGPVEDGARLWGRLPPVVTLHVLANDRGTNRWSIEIGALAVGVDATTQPDPMEMLRILARLPRRTAAGGRPA